MADEEKQKTYGEYVEEAYKLFIKNAKEHKPVSGEEAIEAYFELSASEELKAKVKAEGKTAKDAWAFVTAIARAHRLEHIDPTNVFAIAMHYFEDVPKEAPKNKPQSTAKPVKAKISEEAPKRPAATEAGENAKRKRTAKKKVKKDRQMTFFDMLPVEVEEKPETEGGAGDAEPSGD